MPVPLTARARLGRASHAHLTAQLGRCTEGARSLRPARPAVLSRATVAFPLRAGHCWGRGDSADDRSQDSTASLALGTLGRTRPSHGRRSRGSVWPHVTAGVSWTPWPRLAGTAGREDGHPGSTRGARGARTGGRRGCRACLRRRVGLGERPGPPRGRVGRRGRRAGLRGSCLLRPCSQRQPDLRSGSTGHRGRRGPSARRPGELHGQREGEGSASPAAP